MSELVKRAQDLRSNDQISDFAQEIVNSLRTTENWTPSSHKRYGHIADGAQKTLNDVADGDTQYGHQVILSYNTLNDNTNAALNLQFPDVRNDEMMTGALSYRVNPIVAGFQDRTSRINRDAARESIPQDSAYLNHIPENLDKEEVVGSDIISLSAPAFTLNGEELSEDLETLGRTVDGLDEFYEDQMESVLKTSATEFLSESNSTQERY